MSHCHSVIAFHIDNDRHFGHLGTYTHYWSFGSFGNLIGFLEWTASVNTAAVVRAAVRSSKSGSSIASVVLDPELPSEPQPTP